MLKSTSTNSHTQWCELHLVNKNVYLEGGGGGVGGKVGRFSSDSSEDSITAG